MDLTQQELAESLKQKRNDLFPAFRDLFFVGLSALVGGLSSYGFLSLTTAILFILVYLGVVLFRVLEGIFEQLEWLRHESASQRITVESRIERLAAIVLEQQRAAS